MGKSPVEHQIPISPASANASGSKDSGNNNGGGGTSTSAGTHAPHLLSLTATATASAVTNASREVFQGLFMDLGKQAMSMEAIVRRICGKVDSMESWMTEISFGMTELDLKLRNIAHNIEGTAANVDDEAANVHRWAAPPPPDDRAQVAATVKKKLGPNKKGMKVTGMVASIIDALGTPAEERDKALDSFSSSSSSTTAASASVLASASVAGVAAAHGKKTSVVNAVKKAHKKKTGQQHHDKAGKGKEGVTGNGSSNGDRAKGGDDHVAEEPSSQTETEKSEAPKSPISGEETFATPTVPSLPDQKHDDQVDDVHPSSTGHQGGGEQRDTKRSLDSNRSSASEAGGGGAATNRSVDHDSAEKAEPVAIVEEEEKTDQRALKGADSDTPQKVVEAGTVEKELEQGTTEHMINPDSEQQPTPVTSLELHQVPSQSESKLSSDSQAGPEEAETSASQPVEAANQPFSQTDEARAERQSPLQPQAPQREKVSTSGGHLPPLPQDASEPPRFQLGSPAQPTAIAAESTTESASTPEPEGSVSASALPPAKITKTKSSETQNVDATAESIAPLGKSNSRKALKAAEALAAARRASDQRRSSKMVARKSKAALVVDDGTAVKVDASATQANSSAPSGAETVTSQSPPDASEAKDHELKEAAAEDSDEEEDRESSEDDSGSGSSSDSESDNQNDKDDEEEQDNASASTRKMSKVPGTMTRTITALKKLKKANMLTPEEEEELKQRAQEKWFKLKGHMKEKKKKDVANILLKRKKNVFTVSARIELLEEKSKEVYASIKQLNNDLKTKVDVSAHDTLRRQVHDINQSLQALDHRLTHGTTPAMEKVLQLSKEVEIVRTSFAQQLLFVNDDIAATKLKLVTASDEHCNQLEFLDQSFQQQVAKLTEEHDAKLKSLPDHATAIEGLKRMLRRKADLKLLKELEARLLGRDAESEDCLVRCLSCHKEVVNTTNPDADSGINDAADDSGSHLKKVNPGPSSAKIYRSNVPFSAQLMGAYESIPEDSTQSAGDSYFSAAPSPSVPKSSTRREEPKAAASISSIQIKASRAAMLSPDRPISAPAAALKKKTPYLKAKEKPQAAATPPK